MRRFPEELTQRFEAREILGVGGMGCVYRAHEPDLDRDVAIKLALKPNLQYLERRDDNPFFAADEPADEVETRGGLAELHVFPQGEDGRWAFSGLYNWVDSDDRDADRQTGSLTVNYLLARNLRLLTEGGYDIEEEVGYGTIGLVSGF